MFGGASNACVSKYCIQRGREERARRVPRGSVVRGGLLVPSWRGAEIIAVDRRKHVHRVPESTLVSKIAAGDVWPGSRANMKLRVALRAMEV